MINMKTKIYCLLLALFVCAASVNLSVSNAYARYSNTVSVSTVLAAPSPEMESNCLAMRNEAPVTVLAGELPADSTPIKIPFKVKSAAEVERSFSWYATAEYANYVSITAVHNGTALASGDAIKLSANEEAEIILTIAITSAARSEAHGEIEMNITVIFGDMTGTFRVIIPEVEEGSVSGNGSQSGSANSPETGDENTGSEGENGEDIVTPTEPGGSTETEEGETGEETETPESDITAQAFSNIPAAFSGTHAMQTNAVTETSTDETGLSTEESETSTGETDLSTEESETEENTGTTEGTVDSGTSSGENQYGAGSSQSWVGAENSINTVKSFDKEQKIPVMLTRTSTATSVKLGIYKEEALAAYPDYTRISLDNGESWYVVVNGHIPQFAAGEITGTMLLDFSNANLGEAETVTFAMEALSGGNSEGISKTEATVSNMNICETTVISGTAEMQIAEETAKAVEVKKRVLTKGESLLINFPAEWIPANDSGYSLEYTVDLLTLSENEPRALVRSPITLSEDAANGISAVHIANAEDGIHNLVFHVTEELPQAGTYVVNLKWNYQGICFYETTITFFINYSSQTARPSES